MTEKNQWKGWPHPIQVFVCFTSEPEHVENIQSPAHTVIKVDK